MIKMNKTIAEIGDKVIFRKQFIYKTGVIFEIELPDNIWIVCDNDENLLFCFSLGDFMISEE